MNSPNNPAWAFGPTIVAQHVLFELSTRQNFQGPQERRELFGEVQDDVAEKVESVAEQGLEWPLECFFNRMGCCS